MCDDITLLRQAIDPERIQPLIERQEEILAAAGERLLGCTVHRLFPRGNDRYVIKYLLDTEDRHGRQWTKIVFGEIAAGDPRERRERLMKKLRKNRRGQISKGAEEPAAIVAIPELKMVVTPAGYDAKLPGLSLHHRPRRARRLLHHYLPGTVSESGVVESAILNHRPGKRSILRLRDAETGLSVVVRCLRPGAHRMEENLQTLEALWRAGLRPGNRHGVRVPRTLGGDETLAAAVIEEIPALNLAESGAWDDEERERVAATALAGFHALDLRPARLHSVDEELALLDGWVEFILRLRPELQQLLVPAQAAVAARLRALPPRPPTLTHRDFYAKQVLYDGEQITLLDFDTICLGDPALDLGNHLAHQQVTADPGNETAAFLEAYAELRPLPDRERINAWRDAACLRLVCLYAARSGWQSTVENMATRIIR